MSKNISPATFICQQPGYSPSHLDVISLARMPKPHNRNISASDLAAAARLKAIWEGLPKAQRPTQQALADAWDAGGEANQSLISQFMNGRIALHYRAVMFFAKQLGCKAEQIRNDLPEQAAVKTASDSDAEWEVVKAYAQAVGLGSGPEAQEYAETHKLKFRAESLARKRLNPDRLAVMYGHGDSMEPRIHAGDAILFDTSDTRIRDGYIYVIMVPGAGGHEYQVKRCEVIDDLVFFKADNPHGDHLWRKPRRMDDPRNPTTIIGRVRWIGSWEGT